MDALLVGNDINNVVPGNSWADLLKNLKNYFGVDIEFRKDKPFPMAYEEFYFKAIEHNGYSELDIKKFISEQVNTIKFNDIHRQICDLDVEHILTTNYDLCFEQALGLPERKCKNTGVIKEAKYNLFRNYEAENKNIWHIHGAANHYKSITLGYEHYSGYLQHMRNYVIAGTQNTYKKRKFTSLIRRLKNGDVSFDSWVDLFFTHNIHIFGFGLDFVETDLWWLLTFRQKARLEKSKELGVYNQINYYIPEEYVQASQSKIDVLKSVGVIIRKTPTESSKETYYKKIISNLG